MRLPGLFLLAASSAALLGTAPALALDLSQNLARGGDIACRGPFSNLDTGKTLLARYRDDARVEPSADITGETFESLFLFPRDRHTRLELEERSGTGLDRLQAVHLYQRDSIWTIGGLRLGMTLDQLNKANRGPLTLSGIRQMTGTRFSIVGWITDGACTVVVIFDAPEGAGLDHPLYDTEVKSDDPRLAPLNLRIDELTLTLPAPLDE